MVTQRPKDMMCAQSITPYTEEVVIDTNNDMAEGEYTEDGVIVFKGGKCNLVESKSATSWVKLSVVL